MAQAFILAGGKGERLMPHTQKKPKSMVPVMGQPLLAHNIRWLVSYGFNEITICCGYLHEVIQEHFGTGARLNAKLSYVKEDTPLGRGGAFKKAFENSKGKLNSSVIGLNGDIITNLNLSDLNSFHKANKGLVTVVATPLISPYGIIDTTAAGDVNGFREKPKLPFWINAGIYMFEPEVAELLPDKGDHETTIFPTLAEQGKLKAYKNDAFWRAVDNVKDLNELRKECEQMFFGSFFQNASISN